MSRPISTVVFLVASLAVAMAQQSTPSPGGTYGNWLPGTGGKGQPKEDANTRAVQGAVKSSDNQVVDGAVVQIKNTKSMQVRSFITKADGIFTFTGLSTGVDYEIRASAKGYESPVRTVSTFDDRKRVIVNLKLENKIEPQKVEQKK
jgi:hypothetical protein